MDVTEDMEASKMSKHHIEVNHLDEKKKKSLGNRLIVAGILALVGIPAIVLGGWFYFGFITIMLIGAVYEIVHTSRKKYPWYVWVFTYLIAIAFGYWVFFKDNLSSYYVARDAGTLDTWHISLELHFDSLYLSVFAIAIAIGGYFLFSIFNENFTSGDVGYFVTMTLLVGLGFQALLFVRYYPFAYGSSNTPGIIYSRPWDASVDKSTPVFQYWHSAILILFVFLTTMLNDVWAYFVGMLFGKHHMNPRISPNKTWEGFFGGWILGGISGFAFAMIVDACGFPILPTFKIFGPDTQWWWPFIMSMAIPLIGDVGDLSFSFVKRSFGIKDFSKFMGAHGGILDRADSLIFTCVFSSIFAVCVTVGWNFFL